MNTTLPMATINIFSRLMDFIAPRACAVCGSRLVMDEEVLCARCNMRLPRTGYASDPYDNEMARHFWARIAVERCAALFFYQPHSQVSNMIYDMKYHDHSEIGRSLGRMAAAEFAMSGFFEGIDMIVPVPLEKSRQRKRGYNQSEEIAKGVAEVTGLCIGKEIIERRRHTESQTEMSRLQRADNVEGAFRLLDPATIAGRHVLLVDDIVTTGSTVCACGKELMNAGDVKISILSLGFTKT